MSAEEGPGPLLKKACIKSKDRKNKPNKVHIYGEWNRKMYNEFRYRAGVLSEVESRCIRDISS